MQFTLATLAALAAVGASIVSAQTSAGPPPPGCATTYSGTFEITVSLPPVKKREIEAVSPEKPPIVGGKRLTEGSVKLHVVPELSLQP